MGAFWRGFGVVEFITCAALATAVSFGIVPGIVRSTEHTRVSRAYKELREAALAIESYAIDHRAFPAGTRSAQAKKHAGQLSPFSPQQTALEPIPESTDSNAAREAGSLEPITFRLPSIERGETFATITSPIAYLESLPVDPFSRKSDSPPGYFVSPDGSGWILFSLGPDRDENVYPGPGDIGSRIYEVEKALTESSGKVVIEDSLRSSPTIQVMAPSAMAIFGGIGRRIGITVPRENHSTSP